MLLKNADWSVGITNKNTISMTISSGMQVVCYLHTDLEAAVMLRDRLTVVIDLINADKEKAIDLMNADKEKAAAQPKEDLIPEVCAKCDETMICNSCYGLGARSGRVIKLTITVFGLGVVVLNVHDDESVSSVVYKALQRIRVIPEYESYLAQHKEPTMWELLRDNHEVVTSLTCVPDNEKLYLHPLSPLIKDT